MTKIRSRPTFSSLACIIVCATTLSACGTSLPPDENSSMDAIEDASEPTRPNILFIMSDDHAIKAISAYGDSVVSTPSIDALAENGVLFQNSFVTNSICAPSRAVLLTGKFSHLNGLRDNRDSFNGSQLTFPQLLQDAGYHTSVVGKWHLKSDPIGFDEWKILIGQGEYYSPRFRSSDGTETFEGAYVTDKITDIAIETLDNRDRSKPFVMLYNHKAPHRNWMPSTEDLNGQPEEFAVPSTFDDSYANRPAAEEADMRIADMSVSLDMKLQKGEYDVEDNSGGARYQNNPSIMFEYAWNGAYRRLSPDQKVVWDAYYSEHLAGYHAVKDDPKSLARWKHQRYLDDYTKTITALDRNIGEMVSYLEETGQLDNTIIIYTSDQGFYLGEHGWYDKRFMYEESMRTPLIVRMPESNREAALVPDLVQNIDYAPTILDLAGVQVPEEMQGASLKPFLSGQATGKWRDSLYYHYYEYPHGWHAVRKHYGVRTETHKLIHFYEAPGHWELYDLIEDPDELNNLYGAPEVSAIQKVLHHELTELQDLYGDEL